ncbi:hypothetical protein M2451_003731 [Dysgonomonas sp. PFB1-18]|nr:hypothetical protein [Dysgonomonas sp. PF1-14]MDH6382390.1 hypothetical protein [Dysgonomonas sp. PFB1-18]
MDRLLISIEFLNIYNFLWLTLSNIHLINFRHKKLAFIGKNTYI